MNREYKGKSLIELLDDYTIIDLETTGLSPEYDDIIELAAIKVRHGNIVDSFQQLVNPGYRISSFITGLTGITNEMLTGQPNLKETINKYVEFLGEDIIIGHNVNFDVNFIYDKLFKLTNRYFSNSFVDTMRVSRRVHPEESHHRLSDLTAFYSISVEREHRALEDCKTTYMVYNALIEEINKKFGDFESLKNSLKKQWSYRNNFDLRTLTATNERFDISHPLYKKVCVFTGELERYTRKQAAQMVVDCGGIVENGVTKKTSILILGNNDYCNSIKDGKSTKQKKAEEYIKKGMDLTIMPEDVFYDLFDYCNNSDNDDLEEKTENVSESNIDLQIRICDRVIRLLEDFGNSLSIKYEKSDDITKSVYFIKATAKKSDWHCEDVVKTILKVKTSGKPLILISENYISLLKQNGIPFKKIKSSVDLQIEVNDFDNIPDSLLKELLLEIMEKSFAFAVFGCCSKYSDCEKAGKCLHVDTVYSMFCQYKKIIERN